jgi:hypothetical protein
LQVSNMLVTGKLIAQSFLVNAASVRWPLSLSLFLSFFLSLSLSSCSHIFSMHVLDSSSESILQNGVRGPQPAQLQPSWLLTVCLLVLFSRTQ